MEPSPLSGFPLLRVLPPPPRGPWGCGRDPPVVPSPFRAGYLPSASALGAPDSPSSPSLASCPPSALFPLPGHSQGSQQPQERGQGKDRVSLAQGSRHPDSPGTARKFSSFLPILPECFLVFFPVFIPVPSPVVTGPVCFLVVPCEEEPWEQGLLWDGSSPGVGTPWGGDRAGTGHPWHRGPGSPREARKFSYFPSSLSLFLILSPVFISPSLQGDSPRVWK